MSIDVEIIDPAGNKKFFESALNLASSTRFGIQKALYQTGKDLSGEFNRQVLSKDKTGNLYLIKGRRHTASAPGETPANITGNYRKSIGFNVDGSNQLIFGNSAEYAGFLEVGTLRIAPRSGLLNVINAGQRDIIRNLSTSIKDEI